MTSRYFARNTPDKMFANNCIFNEAADDGRRFNHYIGGGVKESTEILKMTFLQGALMYVENGQWVEISADEAAERKVQYAVLTGPDIPVTTSGLVW